MQIPPVTSTAVQTPAQKNDTKNKAYSVVYDFVNIKDKPVGQKVGIGLITLGATLAGLRSAKGIVLKIANALVMAVIGFAGGIGISEAADKLWQAKKTEKSEKTEQQTVSSDKKAEKKPEDTAKTEKAETKKDDDKD